MLAWGFRLVGSQVGSHWLEPLILFPCHDCQALWSTMYCHGYCVVLIYWSPVGAHLLKTGRFIEGSVLALGHVWRDSFNMGESCVCVFLFHLLVASYLSQFRPCGNTHMRRSIHSVSIRLRFSFICACVHCS